MRDAHHIEMTTLPVLLATLIHPEVLRVPQLGELMSMMVMAQDLKDHHHHLLLLVIVKDVHVIMTQFLVQNVHTLQWLVFLFTAPLKFHLRTSITP